MYRCVKDCASQPAVVLASVLLEINFGGEFRQCLEPF